MKQAYRLNISTIGVHTENGKAVAVLIPAGAMLDRLAEENGFAICRWDGRDVQVLSFDLLERGALVRQTN